MRWLPSLALFRAGMVLSGIAFFRGAAVLTHFSPLAISAPRLSFAIGRKDCAACTLRNAPPGLCLFFTGILDPTPGQNKKVPAGSVFAHLSWLSFLSAESFSTSSPYDIINAPPQAMVLHPSFIFSCSGGPMLP